MPLACALLDFIDNIFRKLARFVHRFVCELAGCICHEVRALVGQHPVKCCACGADGHEEQRNDKPKRRHDRT